MKIEVRQLVPGDEAALEAFLEPRLAFSMLLLGNLRRSGLENASLPFHGLYVAALENGEITAVVAHYWNGNLVLQAPRHTAELVQAALHTSGRPFKGMLGPDEQARDARRALSMPVEQVQLDSREYLYNLPLSDLRPPELLASGGAHTRRAAATDLEQLAAWRMAYNHEAVGDEETPENRQGSRRQVERLIADQRLWVLEIDGRLSAMTGFNADIGEAVQVGGVYTPPELRGRGYARAVVAASLLDARSDGAHTAILFTQHDNYPAQKAYLSLGFQYLGDYRLLLLR
jgi:predicted GNAT family acetyltransferase